MPSNPPTDPATQQQTPSLRLEGRPLATAEDLARHLDVDQSEMLWLLYKAPDEERYRHFEIPKRSGGMRLISAPHGLLREMQDKLHVEFKGLYDAHPAAHGFVEARSIVTNASSHVGKRWVLNVDLVDFFPTINFGRIRGLLMKPPFEMGPAAAAVCAQIVTYRNGLPQGAPTSPVLSNFIASALDRRLLRLARGHKLTYSRFADDITLSTNLAQFPPAIAVREQLVSGDFKVAAGDALEQAIAASGFAINAKKVRIQGLGTRQEVTGLVVNEKLNVERSRIRKIRAMLHAWQKFGLAAAAAEHFTKYRPGKPPSQRLQERAFRNIVYGELSFVRMVRDSSDPVFLKLCAKLLDLDPNPSRFVRQMVFGADDFDVFISHASEDKALIARPIHEALGRRGIKSFLDEDHIGWGENFTKKINTALGAARTVVAIVTSNSVTKDWPVAEVNAALAFEISGHKRVVPVMVGQPDLSKLPLVRTKNWVAWDGDAEAVADRLRDLIEGDPDGGGPAATAVPEVAPAHPSARDARVVLQSLGRRSWISRLLGKD